MEDPVAAAVVHKSDVSKTTWLVNKGSIYRGELYAVSLTTALVHCSKQKNFVIFLDSVFASEPGLGFNVEVDLVYSILNDYTRLTSNGITVVFCWIPCRMNIRGSERTDAAAKSALFLQL